MRLKAYDIVQASGKVSSESFEKVFTASQLRIRKGGTLELNRKAVRTPTDVLLDPVSAQDKAFDTAVAQLAKDNGISVAFSVRSVLEVRGLDRVRLLRNIVFAARICMKMRVNTMIVSGAADSYGLRDPELLMAFGQLIGLTKSQSEWSISEAYGDFI
jgi:RNase P/RNase MRP subunit p30